MSLFKSVKYLDGDEEDAIEITRAGKVLVEFDNGDTFEGTYVTSPDNSGLIRAGHGIYIWKTGGKYDGEYQNGRRNGNGIYVFGNGEKYDGEWLNNVKSGKGKYSYTNGDHFTGTWVGDKRNGKGVFYNAKQDTEVEGEWKDGRLIKDSVKKKPSAGVPAKDVKEVLTSKGKAAPVVEKPVKEEPKKAEPVVEEPKKEEPIVEEPKKEEPVVEEPKKEEPVVEEPKKEEPVVEEPKKEEPVVEQKPEATEELKKEEENPSKPDKDIATLDKVEAEINDTTEDTTTDVLAPSPGLSIDTKAEPKKLDIPLVIVIFGAPASGKGTQCEFISKKFGLVHISTGDLLRAEKEKGSPLGLKAKAAIQAGELVSTELVNEILIERLSRDDIKKNGVLLDGYPRALEQAEFLKTVGVEVDLFIKLEVPDEVLVKRAIGRRKDKKTGKMYHIEYNPPPEGVEVTHREDDKEDKVKERLKVYAKNLGSIEDFYTGKIKTVDGNRERETVTEDVLGIVEEVHASKSLDK